MILHGYASGDSLATNTTTASPWHLAVITWNDLVATYADQLVQSSASIKQTVRASRDENVPDDVAVRLQIRVLNWSTAQEIIDELEKEKETARNEWEKSVKEKLISSLSE